MILKSFLEEFGSKKIQGQKRYAETSNVYLNEAKTKLNQ